MSVKIKRFSTMFTEAAKLSLLFTFICGLVNVAVIISDCTATNDGMIKDLESTVFGTNRSCPNLR